MNEYQDLITEIRNDQHIGTGSCSPVDECLTDPELIELLKEEGIKPDEISKALKFLYHHHNAVSDYLCLPHSIFLSETIINEI